jgi:hypothetical protein
MVHTGYHCEGNNRRTSNEVTHVQEKMEDVGKQGAVEGSNMQQPQGVSGVIQNVQVEPNRPADVEAQPPPGTIHLPSLW